MMRWVTTQRAARTPPLVQVRSTPTRSAATTRQLVLQRFSTTPAPPTSQLAFGPAKILLPVFVISISTIRVLLASPTPSALARLDSSQPPISLASVGKPPPAELQFL